MTDRDASSFNPEDDVLDNLLVSPKAIAVELVAGLVSEPRSIVEVGAFQGELIEAFLERFAEAHGQWTDAGDSMLPVAKRRLERFGDRVTYVIGAAGRDLADGSVTSETDVIISSWVTAHRGAAAMDEFYREAYSLVAPGGCLVVLDHARFDDPRWEQRVQRVRQHFQPRPAGPPAHSGEPIITFDQHRQGLTDAGFTDPFVPWRSLDSALFVAVRSS